MISCTKWSNKLYNQLVLLYYRLVYLRIEVFLILKILHYSCQNWEASKLYTNFWGDSVDLLKITSLQASISPIAEQLKTVTEFSQLLNEYVPR